MIVRWLATVHGIFENFGHPERLWMQGQKQGLKTTWWDESILSRTVELGFCFNGWAKCLLLQLILGSEERCQRIGLKCWILTLIVLAMYVAGTQLNVQNWINLSGPNDLPLGGAAYQERLITKMTWNCGMSVLSGCTVRDIGHPVPYQLEIHTQQLNILKILDLRI